MRYFVRLFWAFSFFTLFAFALNNQQLVTVHWFFGAQSRMPLVIVVLLAFTAGCAVGVLAMLPSWWRQRRATARQTVLPAQVSATPASVQPSSEFGPEHPPRTGL